MDNKRWSTARSNQWYGFTKSFQALRRHTGVNKNETDRWRWCESPDQKWLLLVEQSEIINRDMLVYVFHDSILPRFLQQSITIRELLSPTEETSIMSSEGGDNQTDSLMCVNWKTDPHHQSAIVWLHGTFNRQELVYEHTVGVTRGVLAACLPDHASCSKGQCGWVTIVKDFVGSLKDSRAWPWDQNNSDDDETNDLWCWDCCALDPKLDLAEWQKETRERWQKGESLRDLMAEHHLSTCMRSMSCGTNNDITNNTRHPQRT
jgi:hypothetical protein